MRTQGLQDVRTKSLHGFDLTRIRFVGDVSCSRRVGRVEFGKREMLGKLHGSTSVLNCKSRDNKGRRWQPRRTLRRIMSLKPGRWSSRRASLHTAYNNGKKQT